MSSLRIDLRKILYVLEALAFLNGPVAAHAAFNMGLLTNTLSSDHVRQKEAARSMNRQIFAPAAPNAPSATATDFTYRYNRTRTQQNLRTFVDKSPTAEAKADMEKMIADQPTLMDDLRTGIKPYGLDTHNVADADAFWMINAWLVANKRDEDPGRGTIAIVKRQVRNAFSATPEFANASDADRQQYAEALLLQGTMLSSAFEQWQRKPEQIDQLADAALKGAEASGLDLSKMTLTRNGFVPL
ncbi:MAG: DUF6683 family protein [Erythrobacter sp.]